MMRATQPFGTQLKSWRLQRRLSQLELAADARISTRHLSFIETGRSRPSRGMVLHLAELLDVPLRERNGWLLAAGFSPAFPAMPEASSPALAAVDLVLEAHGVFPAFAVDRCWNLVRANEAAERLLRLAGAVDGTAPINVLRLTLSADGFAPLIRNYRQLRTHLLARLSVQVRRSGDPQLQALWRELDGLPMPATSATDEELESPDFDVLIPTCLDLPIGPLRLFSTITVFGAPLEVPLAELAIETLFPADAASRELLESLSTAAVP